MAIIVYGVYEAPLGIDEVLVKCHSCETDQWADIMVVGKYFHFFMVPIFPVDKDLNLICKKCGLKRYHLPFDSRIIKNYEEIKGKFKYPRFFYTGIGFFMLIIILAVVISILKDSSN